MNNSKRALDFTVEFLRTVIESNFYSNEEKKLAAYLLKTIQVILNEK